MKTVKKILIMAIVVLGASALASCKKSSNNGDGSGKTMKITLKTASLTVADEFKIIVTGEAADGKTITIFDVNGVKQKNKVEFTYDQFRGGPIVLQSLVPLKNVAITVSGRSNTPTSTFSFKIDAIVNSKPQPNVTRIIGGTAFTEDFSY